MARKSKPWSATKFKRCVEKVRRKGKVRDPVAVCAARMWKKTRPKRKRK
jgi:hypothetical protein